PSRVQCSTRRRTGRRPCGRRPAPRSCWENGHRGVLPELPDVRGLRAACTLDYLELYFLTFIEGLEALFIDGRVVDENVGPVGAGNEPVPLLIREPLHGAGLHDATSSRLCGFRGTAWATVPRLPGQCKRPLPGFPLPPVPPVTRWGAAANRGRGEPALAAAGLCSQPAGVVVGEADRADLDVQRQDGGQLGRPLQALCVEIRVNVAL